MEKGQRILLSVKLVIILLLLLYHTSSICFKIHLWVLALSTTSFQAFLLLASSFQFFTFKTITSLHTSSNILFATHVESILCLLPNHPILWAWINLMMSAPLTKRLRSILLCIPNAWLQYYFVFSTYFFQFVVVLISCLGSACQIYGAYFYIVH